MTIGDFKPDLTFVLDIDPVRSIARTRKKRTAKCRRCGKSDRRFEAQGETLQEIVRQAYLDIAAADPQRCRVVDGGQDVDKVAQELWTILEREMAIA